MIKIDKTMEEKIRQICTTLKTNGGGYYNLSEEQFTKLFNLFEESNNQLITEIEKLIDEKYYGDCRDGFQNQLKADGLKLIAIRKGEK